MSPEPKVVFVSVCGGDEEYDFVLGAMRHHAKMGPHIVLDTTPPERRRVFSGLPDSVTWVYDPNYGSGWKDFNSRAAVRTVCDLARKSGAEVVVYTDCDEFWGPDCRRIFEAARTQMVSVETFHWRKDGNLYGFGPTEIHKRLWPASMDISIPVNEWWVNKSPHYNGNPNRHVLVEPPKGQEVLYVPGLFHHHMHYALGRKSEDENTAKTTIVGWPDGGRKMAQVEWPTLLARWRDEGIRPSEAFPSSGS